MPFLKHLSRLQFIGLTCVLSIGAFAAPFAPRIVSWSASRLSCDIKGNISIETGERIFHVPGQKYYAETVISPRYGERWFCSEAEARAAGWRKSGV